MAGAESLTVLTVGHSTRPQDGFIDLLKAHHVSGIADVRRFPGSRRHPQFARERLAAWLPAAGIDYRHFEALGGRRRPAPDSPNTGWEHPAFRAYADYTSTTAFEEALEALLAFATAGRIAVMCAEAQWWRCHRRLIADALVVRGHDIRHIMGTGEPLAHTLPPFARVEGTSIAYPGAALEASNRKAPS